MFLQTKREREKKKKRKKENNENDKINFSSETFNKSLNYVFSISLPTKRSHVNNLNAYVVIVN